MEFPEALRRYRFRQLVALFGVSFIYDILWFFINRDDEDDEEGGGLERNVQKFSRIISYISFFWRIILAIILEKVSLDFLTILKGKNTNMKNVESLDYKVKQIIEAHDF